MSDKFRDKSAILIAGGIAAAAAGYFLALVVFPLLFPAILTRQLDRSSQEVARFLQRARTESVGRGFPVACRVEQHGSRTVLWLDWDVLGGRVHLKGDTLELPRGLVLSQDENRRTSGVIAIFNPRGGFTVASNSASTEPLVLKVLRPSRPADSPREISMTRTGDFQARPAAPQPPLHTASASTDGSPQQSAALKN
jgi:hypothetical protein